MKIILILLLLVFASCSKSQEEVITPSPTEKPKAFKFLTSDYSYLYGTWTIQSTDKKDWFHNTKITLNANGIASHTSNGYKLWEVRQKWNYSANQYEKVVLVLGTSKYSFNYVDIIRGEEYLIQGTKEKPFLLSNSLSFYLVK